MSGTTFKNPTPTVDAVIRIERDGVDHVVLIRRSNPPAGWALPGGFVDEGERLDLACAREAREETGLDVVLEELLYVYSDPSRDLRKHTVSAVFTARRMPWRVSPSWSRACTRSWMTRTVGLVASNRGKGTVRNSW